MIFYIEIFFTYFFYWQGAKTLASEGLVGVNADLTQLAGMELVLHYKKCMK
jgi:hypothetical protein